MQLHGLPKIDCGGFQMMGVGLFILWTQQHV